MAEQFLTLMADLDENSQVLLGEWSEKLNKAGFIGKQTPGLPFHISLAIFSLDKEKSVICEMQRLAAEFCEALVFTQKASQGVLIQKIHTEAGLRCVFLALVNRYLPVVGYQLGAFGEIQA